MNNILNINLILYFLIANRKVAVRSSGAVLADLKTNWPCALGECISG
jgi:hypothetical protein